MPKLKSDKVLFKNMSTLNNLLIVTNHSRVPFTNDHRWGKRCVNPSNFEITFFIRFKIFKNTLDYPP